MTLSKFDRWGRVFRKAAKVDRYKRFRTLLAKLELPDRPELLMEGTVQFVHAVAAYATVDRQSSSTFLEMQSYDPGDAQDAMYVFTFDICGKSFGRVLLTSKVGILDLADLYGHPWYNLERVGYNSIYVSRADGRNLTSRDVAHLQKEVVNDLRFDYGEDEVEIEFDCQLIRGVLKVAVQDYKAQ
jgi:hypothetical protein